MNNEVDNKNVFLIHGYNGIPKIYEWLENRACKEFLVTESELENFKSRCSKKYSIYSNNDHIVPFEILQEYPKSIDAIPILIENIGHMGKKSGLEEIPKVVDIIKENDLYN